VALIVLEAVLDGCDSDDETEGKDSEEGRADGEGGCELDDGHKEEKHIGDSAELLKQVLWEEGEGSVFGGVDTIGPKGELWETVLIEILGWGWDVDKHSTRVLFRLAERDLRVCPCHPPPHRLGVGRAIIVVVVIITTIVAVGGEWAYRDLALKWCCCRAQALLLLVLLVLFILLSLLLLIVVVFVDGGLLKGGFNVVWVGEGFAKSFLLPWGHAIDLAERVHHGAVAVVVL
jgi:hypothetical protein